MENMKTKVGKLEDELTQLWKEGLEPAQWQNVETLLANPLASPNSELKQALLRKDFGLRQSRRALSRVLLVPALALGLLLFFISPTGPREVARQFSDADLLAALVCEPPELCNDILEADLELIEEEL